MAKIQPIQPIQSSTTAVTSDANTQGHMAPASDAQVLPALALDATQWSAVASDALDYVECATDEVSQLEAIIKTIGEARVADDIVELVQVTIALLVQLQRNLIDLERVDGALLDGGQPTPTPNSGED